MNKVPTTVFSGFLGSGKTTIISHLIEELQNSNQQIVYIKNEIGDADVDGKLLEGKGIKTRELLNGCICCTLVGPFANSIEEVIEKFSPDRILIEASGAADPSALALMISSHPDLKLDGVVGIVDVVNFEGYKDLSITAINQTKFIDLIIFNKVEEVDLEKKRAVVGYVRELNAHSPIVEALDGKISSSIVFGLNKKELEELKKEAKNSEAHHIDEDKIQTFNLNPSGSFNKDELVKTLAKTSANIFRIKGFVKLEDKKFHLFNTVGEKTDFQDINDDQITENLLIFIGFLAHQQEPDIKNLIESIIKP